MPQRISSSSIAGVFHVTSDIPLVSSPPDDWPKLTIEFVTRIYPWIMEHGLSAVTRVVGYPVPTPSGYIGPTSPFIVRIAGRPVKRQSMVHRTIARLQVKVDDVQIVSHCFKIR